MIDKFILSIAIKLLTRFFNYVTMYAPDEKVCALHFAIDEKEFEASIDHFISERNKDVCNKDSTVSNRDGTCVDCSH